ncbi:hypothetical protein DL768_011097 [Monosporascus sp. mg162]|nr:hypothetical protein DL768_011097 [Monosporascus sp. mg162]
MDRDKNKAICGIGPATVRKDTGGAGPAGAVDVGVGAGAGVTAGRTLASATGRHLGVKLTVADYRHVAIELGRKIRGLVIRQLKVNIGADDGGGGQVADGECGYDEDPATGEAKVRRRMEYIWDLQATRLWHQYLSLGDGGGAPPLPASAPAPDTERARKRRASAAAGGGDGQGRGVSYDGGRYKKRKTPGGGGEDGDGGVDIENGFRRLLGEGARWRSGEQRDAMAKQLAARTGRDEPPREALLVVVSADLAGSDKFTAYADGLRVRGLLRRIFIDECHTIIMDAGYRAGLAGLKGLYRFDRPVILLMATLPVRLKRWFRQEIVAGDAAIVRAATVKRNIRYRVTTVPPGATAVVDEVVPAVDCRRVGFGAFMDGRGRDCDEVGGERCNRCRRGGPGLGGGGGGSAATGSPAPPP